MADYSDQEVVAAFNSCLDLGKWNQLPSAVKARFESLLCHNRIKAVCFMDDVGLGLRVWLDHMPVCRYDDEVETTAAGQSYGIESPVSVGQCDLAGSWMRCPAKLWQPKEWFLVMDECGKKWWVDTSNSEDDDEEDTEVNGSKQWRWSTSRSNGTKVEGREKATQIARQLDGLVVKHIS